MNALLKHRATPRLGGLGVLIAVAWMLPYQMGGYAIHVVDVALIFALLAIGMGLAMGIAGQINLAQIAFFGVSAYATAILTTRGGLGFWPAAVLAMVASALVGLLVGIPALRMQSHYLGIVTLGLALGFINWTTNAELAGGAEGISAIPVPPLFGIDLSSEYLYYYLEVVVFAAALAFGLFVVRTGLGRRLMAMRDDPLAAGAVGAEIPLLRMTAFMLSSLYGGVAGVLYVGLIRFIAPETFNIANMFLLLAMVVIGGRQSLVGCVVGAIGLTLIREQLVDYPSYTQLGFGAVVVVMVVFAPTGLAGIPARVKVVVDRGREADALLARFGLTEFATAPPGSLPYGIQRRIEIARAMAGGPRLLLLDEPAAGLNGEEVRQLAEIVRSIRGSGVTVVLIEHNMGLVMSLCERVTVLSGGAVIAEGTPAEVADDHAVIEAYLGDSAMADLPLPTTEVRP